LEVTPAFATHECVRILLVVQIGCQMSSSNVKY